VRRARAAAEKADGEHDYGVSIHHSPNALNHPQIDPCKARVNL